LRLRNMMQKGDNIIPFLQERGEGESATLLSVAKLLTGPELYKCTPYKGHPVSWKDADVQASVAGRLGCHSVLWELALNLGPHGLFNEQPCGKPGCRGGRLDSVDVCSSETKECQSMISAHSVAVARRCLAFGNKEARAGRILEAALWYTRGLLQALPNGWEIVSSVPSLDVRSVALALGFNRSRMYLELERLDHLATRKLRKAERGESSG